MSDEQPVTSEVESDADKIVGAIEGLTGAVGELTEEIFSLRDLLLKCTFRVGEDGDKRAIRTCDIGD